jgi:hypothetical protein
MQFGTDFDWTKEVTTIRLIKLGIKGQHSTLPEQGAVEISCDHLGFVSVTKRD